MLSTLRKGDDHWDGDAVDGEDRFGPLHREHQGLHRDNVKARRSSLVQTTATILTLMILAVGGAWTFWAWAGDAHSQTEVNTKAISDMQSRLDELSASLKDGSAVTSDLREEVSELRADMRNSREQRDRIIELLDQMNKRLREVE